MLCITCGANIPHERILVLPETQHCIKCSQVQAYKGITTWEKTTPELLIVNDELANRFWEFEKVDGRGAWRL